MKIPSPEARRLLEELYEETCANVARSAPTIAETYAKADEVVAAHAALVEQCARIKATLAAWDATTPAEDVSDAAIRARIAAWSTECRRSLLAAGPAHLIEARPLATWLPRLLEPWGLATITRLVRKHKVALDPLLALLHDLFLAGRFADDTRPFQTRTVDDFALAAHACAGAGDFLEEARATLSDRLATAMLARVGAWKDGEPMPADDPVADLLLVLAGSHAVIAQYDPETRKAHLTLALPTWLGHAALINRAVAAVTRETAWHAARLGGPEGKPIQGAKGGQPRKRAAAARAAVILRKTFETQTGKGRLAEVAALLASVLYPEELGSWLVDDDPSADGAQLPASALADIDIRKRLSDSVGDLFDSYPEPKLPG